MNDEKLMQAIRAAIEALPREKTMLLPALLIVQEELGFLPRWAMEEVGKWLRVPKSEVYGAATSYASLDDHPPAQHQVKICTGAGCRMNGSERLMRKAEEYLEIKREEETPDGSLKLGKVDCAFVCGVAPVVRVDGVTFGRMTEDDLVREIEPFKRREDGGQGSRSGAQEPGAGTGKPPLCRGTE